MGPRAFRASPTAGCVSRRSTASTCGWRPTGGCGRGSEGIAGVSPAAQRAGLSMFPLASRWYLACEPVACVVPRLVQEIGAGARSIESKRAEVAGLPAELRLTAEDVQE